MFKLDRQEMEGIFIMFFLLPVITIGGTLLILANCERTRECQPGYVEVKPGICVTGYDTRKAR